MHQRLATMPKAADKDTEKLVWFMIEDIFNDDAEYDRLSLSLSLHMCVYIYLYIVYICTWTF
jgi:hypothetical protein